MREGIGKEYNYDDNQVKIGTFINDKQIQSKSVALYSNNGKLKARSYSGNKGFAMMYFDNGQPMYIIDRPDYLKDENNDSLLFDYEMKIIKSWNNDGIDQTRETFLKEINYFLKKDSFHKYVSRRVVPKGNIIL